MGLRVHECAWVWVWVWVWACGCGCGCGWVRVGVRVRVCVRVRVRVRVRVYGVWGGETKTRHRRDGSEKKPTLVTRRVHVTLYLPGVHLIHSLLIDRLPQLGARMLLAEEALLQCQRSP